MNKPEKVFFWFFAFFMLIIAFYPRSVADAFESFSNKLASKQQLYVKRYYYSISSEDQQPFSLKVVEATKNRLFSLFICLSKSGKLEFFTSKRQINPMEISFFPMQFIDLKNCESIPKNKFLTKLVVLSGSSEKHTKLNLQVWKSLGNGAFKEVSRKIQINYPKPDYKIPIEEQISNFLIKFSMR